MPISATFTAAAENIAESGLDPSDLFAGLAILISIYSAGVAWRIHKESGGRVEVTMHPAYYRPFAGIGSIHVGRSKHMLMKEPRGAVIEMAEISIQNAGRTGVTITGVTLKVAQGKVELGQATPRTFILRGILGHETNGETYFRIDPYDQRTLLVDYWSVVDAAFKQDPALNDLHLYAEVTVGGHSLPQNSKGLGYWRITRDRISSLGSGLIRRPRNAFLLAMVRNNMRDLGLMDNLDYIARKVEQQIRQPAEMGETLTMIGELMAGVEGEIARQQWADELDRGAPISHVAVARYLVNQSHLHGDSFRGDPISEAGPHVAPASAAVTHAALPQ